MEIQTELPKTMCFSNSYHNTAKSYKANTVQLH